MEHNGLAGGIFSGMNSGMLGLEMPLHQQQQQQQQNHQNAQNSHQLHHPQIVAAYASRSECDHHHLQSRQSAKISHPYPPTSAKPKPQSPHSDEDDPCFNGDIEITSDGKRKAASVSPWQRMKWTDNMIRLLIMAVFYIGDEAGSEPNDPSAKKKSAGVLSQKKGKWKSVSRAMMEKGFYVSPQQCEDKFNDLNKRYKRVNDILGKGTACKVVENQSLLESMDLSPKMKEEVKKLLNSKHLFFREMCAYHNSCGHIASNSVGPVNDRSLIQPPQPSHNSLQQGCSHSPQNAQVFANSRAEAEGPKRVPIGEKDYDEEEGESEEDGDDSEEDDDDDDDAIEGNPRGQNNGYGDHDEDDHAEKPDGKRQITTPTAATEQVFSLSSAVMQQLNSEVMGVIEDGGKSKCEKKHWMKARLMQLEEQQVWYQYQAFELEKQRLKWVKFSSKKEREMERSKLENGRRRLENERMVLLLRQKEHELLDPEQIRNQQQFSSNKRADPSSITG